MRFLVFIKKFSLDIIGIFLVLCLYGFYYYNVNHNIKSGLIDIYIENPAFDKLNYFISDQNIKIKNIPDVLIIGVDDKFLKKRGLIDENGKKTKKYGSSVPRKYIDQIIEKLDKQPNIESLFIDYDLYICTKTADEQSLINTLKKKRNYSIYFYHNGTYNCLEDYNVSKNLFASALNQQDDDLLTRKYLNFNAKLHPNIAFVLTNNQIPKNQEKYSFDIIKNKIIYKAIKKGENQSYWNNLYLYSADENISKILKEHNKSIVLFGEIASKSEDIKSIYNLIKGTDEIYGIYNVANMIMTQFYLNGFLKPIPFLAAFGIFIIVYILVRIIVDKISLFLYKKYKIKKDGILNISITIFVVIGIFFIISWWIMLNYKMWYNYYIPSFMALVLKGHEIKNIFLRILNFIKGGLQW